MNLQERQEEMRRGKERQPLRRVREPQDLADIAYRHRREQDAERERIKQRNQKTFRQEDYRTFSPEAKLEVLKQFADVVLNPLGLEELKRRRRVFDGVKNAKFPIKTTSCWVCTLPSAHRHHVILLRNGGSVTGRKNIVVLCEGCHCKIHPWMEENRPKLLAVKDFDLARVKNDALTLLERAAKGRIDASLAETKILELLHSVINILAE